jgi:hypothetical protein
MKAKFDDLDDRNSMTGPNSSEDWFHIKLNPFPRRLSRPKDVSKASDSYITS